MRLWLRLRLRWEVVLFWRLMGAPRGLRAASSTEAALPDCGAGPGVDTAVAAWRTLRALAEEPVRWWRRSALVEGRGKPGPDRRCVSANEEGFCVGSVELDALVEEALETTEEFCAARSMVKSRVRRLT